MRPNRVKQTLARGGSVVGTMMMEFATTGVARIAAAAGCDFAVFDMEHTGWSMETARMLMATSRSADIVPLVRPPTCQYHFMARLLDVGAMGLVVPLVNSVEQAREIVQSAKYPPAGRRGSAFSIAHDDYQDADVTETMRSSNDEVLLIAQIETAQAAEQVEKIAAVDGIDVLWIGHFDLTASMGIPGEFSHPEFLEVSQRILQACQKAGKAAGFGGLDVEDVCQAKQQGFRFLVYIADLWIYQRALREGVKRIRG